MTSSHICKVAEFKDSTFLKAHCACGSDECIHSLIIEKDEYNVTLIIQSTAFTEYCDYSFNDTFFEKVKWWFNTQKKKIGWISDILFKGHIKVDNYFLFDNDQAIDNYITALTEAKNKLKDS